MKVAEVIGTVTLSRCHPSFQGATLKVVAPLSLNDLQKEESSADAELVAWDEYGSGIGSLIAISEGGEAAQPFRPEMKPVDCYNAAIIDQIHLENTTR